MVVVAAAALWLGLAAESPAALKPGRYVGMTAQGERFAFKAKKRGVKKFAFRVFVDCEDRSRQRLEGSGGMVGYEDTGKGKGKGKGKGRRTFELEFTGGEFTLRVSGKLRRKRAAGKIETAGSTSSGVDCTGSVQWTAKRKPRNRRR